MVSLMMKATISVWRNGLVQARHALSLYELFLSPFKPSLRFFSFFSLHIHRHKYVCVCSHDTLRSPAEAFFLARLPTQTPFVAPSVSIDPCLILHRRYLKIWRTCKGQAKEYQHMDLDL